MKPSSYTPFPLAFHHEGGLWPAPDGLEHEGSLVTFERPSRAKMTARPEVINIDWLSPLQDSSKVCYVLERLVISDIEQGNPGA